VVLVDSWNYALHYDIGGGSQMNTKPKSKIALVSLSFVILLAACSSGPVRLHDNTSANIDLSQSRPISSRGCGFQLLLVIPISVNSRLERAYDSLARQADGWVIGDIQIQESWWYGYVGTIYCTHIKARAYRKV